MREKLPQEILDELDNFEIDLSIIESISRILLDELRMEGDLEKFDVENLSNVLKRLIIETSKNFRNIHHKLEFNNDKDSLSSPSSAS